MKNPRRQQVLVLMCLAEQDQQPSCICIGAFERTQHHNPGYGETALLIYQLTASPTQPTRASKKRVAGAF